MIRLSAIALTLAAFSMPAMAQEVVPPEECEPTTLVELFAGVDDENCLVEEGGDELAEEEEGSDRNPVSVAAKLPGSNREAALAHANERSNGAVEAAHSRHSEDSGERGNGNGNGNGKK